MARRPRKKPPSEAALQRHHERTALNKIAEHLRCDEPLVEDLSPEQIFALHQFFHQLLAAGYELYRRVPPIYADPIIKEKFGLVIPPDPNFKR